MPLWLYLGKIATFSDPFTSMEAFQFAQRSGCNPATGTAKGYGTSTKMKYGKAIFERYANNRQISRHKCKHTSTQRRYQWFIVQLPAGEGNQLGSEERTTTKG